MTRDERLIDALRRALDDAALHISELGCTCVSRRYGHQRGCTGAARARGFNRLLRRAHRRLRRDGRAQACRRPRGATAGEGTASASPAGPDAS